MYCFMRVDTYREDIRLGSINSRNMHLILPFNHLLILNSSVDIAIPIYICIQWDCGMPSVNHAYTQKYSSGQ